MSEKQAAQVISNLNKIAKSLSLWERKGNQHLITQLTNEFISVAENLPRRYAMRLTDEAYCVYTRYFN